MSAATLDRGAAGPVIVPVLMAGGSGTRLWPLSREAYPKQFLPLTGDRTLLELTALRAREVAGEGPMIVIGGEQHRFVIAEQLRRTGLDDVTVLIEPEGRNTAPAAAAAAHYIADRFGADAILFLMAADQAMTDVPTFVKAARAGAQAARDGRIVVFGIRPTGPETGFGYIRAGDATGDGVLAVDAFVEKPDLDKAKQFLSGGHHYWNGGMFLARVDAFVAELERLEPAMNASARRAVSEARTDIDFVRLDPAAFRECRSVSIDYAVMEKTRAIALVPLDAGWDDVGSWTFLGRLPATDAAGNRARGDVLVEDAHDNLIHATSRLVTLVGVRDHVVVETSDSILIATRDRVQDVKKIVQKLKAAKRIEAESHPQVARPWGSYESIATGPRFQVKRVVVKPGGKLSLQMHHHRAEHWIVVTGTAKVTVGEKEFLLSEDESTYIPLGHKHRLENPGKVPLELIEVQSGGYLDEDDIVRFEDVYGRTPAA